MPDDLDRDRDFKLAIDAHGPIDGPQPATPDFRNDLIGPDAAADEAIVRRAAVNLLHERGGAGRTGKSSGSDFRNIRLEGSF